jgi:hypothetical protein
MTVYLGRGIRGCLGTILGPMLAGDVTCTTAMVTCCMKAMTECAKWKVPRRMNGASTMTTTWIGARCVFAADITHGTNMICRRVAMRVVIVMNWTEGTCIASRTGTCDTKVVVHRMAEAAEMVLRVMGRVFTTPITVQEPIIEGKWCMRNRPFADL